MVIWVLEMIVIVPILVEVILIVVILLSLKRRNELISRYPELKRPYDYGTLTFVFILLAKSLFLILDLRDHGLIVVSQTKVVTINLMGNLMLLGALLMFLIGWSYLLKVLTEKYELVPVIEFQGEENHEPLKPGLYLCNLPNCYPVIAKLLHGRAGLIVSRNPPEMVREKLKIEKTPILWLTKVRDRNAVSPTRLEFLLQTMVDFMRKTEDSKIIFLDGVEYLILENGFVPVFKFLTALKDYTTIYNAIIIVPVREESLDEKRLGLLHREFERLRMKPS